MKTTRKIVSTLLPWMFVSLWSLATSAPAMALDMATPRIVWIQGYGAGGFVSAGTWTLLELEQNIAGYCRYAVQWDSTGPGGLIVSGNVYLDEQKTLGHTNCTINSMQDFPTTIFLAPGPGAPPSPTSQGMTRFHQLAGVSSMVLSEGLGLLPIRGLALTGTVLFTNGRIPVALLMGSSSRAPAVGKYAELLQDELAN